MSTQRKTIDLRQYRSPGVRVFSGRERAQAIREACDVRPGDDVSVVLPDDVVAVAAAFTRTLVGDASHLTVDGPQYYVETMLDDWREYVDRFRTQEPTHAAR
jgi:hypothetical protein